MNSQNIKNQRILHKGKNLIISWGNEFGLIELASVQMNTNVLIKVEEIDGLIIMLLEAKMKEKEIKEEEEVDISDNLNIKLTINNEHLGKWNSLQTRGK